MCLAFGRAVTTKKQKRAAALKTAKICLSNKLKLSIKRQKKNKYHFTRISGQASALIVYDLNFMSIESRLRMRLGQFDTIGNIAGVFAIGDPGKG